MRLPLHDTRGHPTVLAALSVMAALLHCSVRPLHLASKE
jgi:hypothetical protein